MATTPQISKLKEILFRFESMIASVPDQEDINAWCNELQDVFDQLKYMVQIRRRQLHDKLFGEIEVQDPSRRSEVERLQNADNDIGQLLEIVNSQIIALRLPRPEIEQPNMELYALELVDRGNELIHWIRDQEETVATWFVEAFEPKAAE